MHFSLSSVVYLDNKFQQTMLQDNENNFQTIDPDVLEAIKQKLENEGYSKVKIKTYPENEKGDHFLGFITQVTINATYNNKEKELNWIAKSAPQSEVFREKYRTDQVYKREVNMYQILERFRLFQIERGVIDAFTSYATFLLSYLKPHKECFIMEDMKHQGYILKDHLIPLDYNHVKFVLKEYGKLHAISFALKDQKPEEFKKIAEETCETFFTMRDSSEWDLLYKSHGQKLLYLMNQDLEQNAIKPLELFRDNASVIIKKLLRDTNEFSVICHGDNWMNNMLWKYEDIEHPEQPTKLCLLDFQLGRYGSPATDLSYFLYACADPKILEENYMEMLTIYHESLSKHLKDLGSDPKKVFPFDALLEELKMKSLFGFQRTTLVLAVVLRDKSSPLDWYTSKNLSEMIKSIDFINVYDDMFKKRAKAAIWHMVKMDYFAPLMSYQN